MAATNPTIRAVLFDFDGTLVDSFAAIAASTNHVRGRYGLPPLAEAEVRRHVGYGLEHLLQTLVPDAPLDEAVACYRQHHARVLFPLTRLMPGVAETVPELARRGYRLGICSNKRREFTQQLVEASGLTPYFRCVLGPEDVGHRPKPDPTMLLEGLKRLEVAAAEAVYVGDMTIDVRTARAAGVVVWLVRGGAESSWDAATPDRVLDHFADLLTALPPVSDPPLLCSVIRDDGAAA